MGRARRDTQLDQSGLFISATAMKILGDFKPGELMDTWVENTPMKRAGEGKDVAGLVVFLVSAFITGQTINVDGGLIVS